MKKVLPYFSVENAYGGSQDWFSGFMMHVGGCAAATACDSSIYFAKEWGMTPLYPYDLNRLDRAAYVEFGERMRPYLTPRMGGIRRLSWYIDGYAGYLADIGQKDVLKMQELSGHEPYGKAEDLVRRQIDAGIPVPCLMLMHQDKKRFYYFLWHWFLIVGYEDGGDAFQILAATYGTRYRLPFADFWDTGQEERGGLIEYVPS